MEPKTYRTRSWNTSPRSLVAVWCAVMLVPGEQVFLAQEKAPAPAAAKPAEAAPKGTAEAPAPKLPPEQIDALVAPIALYPDPLLAQTLVAATYPLEIIQLHQWMVKHPELKDDQARADAVAKQPWDASIQSMAAVPEVVKRLAEDIQWTTELGNAFLAQQSDVMDAVQRMRGKAKANGALESNQQQKVETKVIEKKTVIVVESASPEVIYVPSYSPTVVYGPPVYPYPPIYYPPYPPGAAFVSFSFGVMMGAAMWGGSCCGCGWGGSNVNVNVNNNFNRNTNVNARGGNNNWQHNPQHRGAAPYSDRATASKYGGGGAGDRSAARNRASSAQQRGSGTSRAASAGAGNRSAGAGASNRSASGSRGSGAAPSSMDRGGGGSRGAGTSGNQIGSRDIPRSSASSSRGGGFGGDSSGFSGSSARASSSRGASSMGSRGRGGGGGGGRRR